MGIQSPIAITDPGIFLSQPEQRLNHHTTALPQLFSIESAMTSLETKENAFRQYHLTTVTHTDRVKNQTN
jgi:hypothetical protein